MKSAIPANYSGKVIMQSNYGMLLDSVPFLFFIFFVCGIMV